MCFSSSASFTASALLSLIGLISISKVKRKNDYLFAATPLLFGIQQFCEGMAWRIIPTAQGATIPVMGFLFFACIVWPLWIPLSLIIAERNHHRRMLMIPCLVSGMCVALIISYSWLFELPTATIENCHILYFIPNYISPWFLNTAFYLYATIIPFYFSSIEAMKWMGTALALSYVASYVFYYTYMFSAWCFFAAILSILVAIII